VSETGASPHLKRVLGRWDLVLLFVVAITNLNVVPVVAANGAVTVWLWLLALLLFFWPQGIAVIELSRRYPGEGGIYLWTREELGRFHGFLSGWCYWTNNIFYVPTVLFYLVGVALYVGGPEALHLADNRLFMFVATAGLLGLLTAANVRGLGVGKWINNLGGIGTAVASLALIGLALASLAGHGSELSLATAFPQAPDFRLVSSFGVICFALVGLELASVMGDEIRDPRGDLPGAIVWGGVVSGLLYVGATLAILVALPEEEVGVLNGVMQAVQKLADVSGLSPLVPALALVLTISVVGIASAWFAGSARIPFVAGLDHYLPEGLGRLHPRHGTPFVALITQAVLSAAVIALNLVGATAREAFVTLLDLAVVLQLVPYVYVFLVLLRLAAPAAPEPASFRKPVLRAAGCAGLLTTCLGMALAFVPSREIASIWVFEAKLIGGCALFLGVAVAFFLRGQAVANRIQSSLPAHP
jgi:amino acid transporter